MTQTQTAPYPVVLDELVNNLRYKEGWRFSLEHVDRGQGSEGLTLCIHLTGPDAYHPENLRPVMHYMIVPAAAFDRQSWQRWLFDQIAAVETHERCEWFEVHHPMRLGLGSTVADEWSERPYAPNHGPGRDPYVVFEYATDEQARTSFRGEIKT